MSAPTPPRRWFRFSLRTLFVVVTVGCVWLGYSLNWIRQRREAIEDGEVSIVYYTHRNIDAEPNKATAPALLWLLGARGYRFLETNHSDRVQRYRELYPESKVYDSSVYVVPSVGGPDNDW